jgi:hypothetical protein
MSQNRKFEVNFFKTISQQLKEYVLTDLKLCYYYSSTCMQFSILFIITITIIFIIRERKHKKVETLIVNILTSFYEHHIEPFFVEFINFSQARNKLDFVNPFIPFTMTYTARVYSSSLFLLIVRLIGSLFARKVL